MTIPANAVLAELTRAEARRHPPRTHERRAASWVFTALATTKTVDGARRALADCPDESVCCAATILLCQLAEQAEGDTATTEETTTT